MPVPTIQSLPSKSLGIVLRHDASFLTLWPPPSFLGLLLPQEPAPPNPSSYLTTRRCRSLILPHGSMPPIDPPSVRARASPLLSRSRTVCTSPTPMRPDRQSFSPPPPPRSATLDLPSVDEPHIPLTGEAMSLRGDNRFPILYFHASKHESELGGFPDSKRQCIDHPNNKF